MKLNEAARPVQEKPMKQTLLAAVMAAALMTPFAFAAQDPAPATSANSKTTTTKKHKKTTKKVKPSSSSASTAASPKK
jgi:hypothetical protein